MNKLGVLNGSSVLPSHQPGMTVMQAYTIIYHAGRPVCPRCAGRYVVETSSGPLDSLSLRCWTCKAQIPHESLDRVTREARGQGEGAGDG